MVLVACHKVHNKNKDDNDDAYIEDSETDLSDSLVFKPSSVMGSASHHKVRDKNKDDNHVVDIEDSEPI